MLQEKTIQLTIPPDVAVFCDLMGITAEDLLSQYLKDLCSLPNNSGSSPRALAKVYFIDTHLSQQTIFTSDSAEALLSDFETIYLNAYPAVGNTGWEQHRAQLLTELHTEWLQRKEAVTE
jgi:hypothetical protein